MKKLITINKLYIILPNRLRVFQSAEWVEVLPCLEKLKSPLTTSDLLSLSVNERINTGSLESIGRGGLLQYVSTSLIYCRVAHSGLVSVDM